MGPVLCLVPNWRVNPRRWDRDVPKRRQITITLLRNIPEERRSHWRHSGNLKSRSHQVFWGTVLIRNLKEWLYNDPTSYLGGGELLVTLDLFSTNFWATVNVYCNILTRFLWNVHKIWVHASYYTTYLHQQERAINITCGNSGVSFHVLY